MYLKKRQLLKTLAAGLTVPYLPVSQAQNARYPNKAVSIIVPYPAGGGSDTVTRIIAQPLAAKLGQSAVVENVAGAGGLIGVRRLRTAPADGYTLLHGSLSEFVLVPLNTPSSNVNSDDFTLLQLSAELEHCVLVRKGLPVNSMDALLAHADAAAKQSKPLTYASAGIGSTYHLLGERLSQLTGIDMTHVPYQGHAPAERAVLAEEVDFYLSPFLGHHLDHHKQGRLNILAVLTKTRDPRWPNYPAIGEFPRIQDLTFTMWTGFFVRKGIPDPVMQTLNQALAQSIPTDAVRTKVEAFNQRIPTMLNLAEAGRFYAQGVQEYRALAATVGLV